MTKLSKAQNEALLEAVLNERKQHRFLHDSNLRNTRTNEYARPATLRALETKGLVDGNEWALTAAGRKVAIDLLYEGAAKEMESMFAEKERQQTQDYFEGAILRKIVKVHGLQYKDVYLRSFIDLRNQSTYHYDIDFKQGRRGKRMNTALVNIHWSQNEYAIKTMGTDLNTTEAKRMSELMLIAVQVIESGVLS